MEKIKWHLKNNHLVFIVSASPDIYVQYISEYLQCDGYICTELSYINNKFTGMFNGDDCTGVEKVNAIERLYSTIPFDKNKTYAYSDNESDLPLLEFVAHPNVVTPTKKLEKIANKRKWKIYLW